MDQLRTYDLLERWRDGDDDALSALLQRDMEWIRSFVHRRLDSPMRKFGDTEDFVQETALSVLRYGPRFVMSSREQFRGLLATITLNLLRGKRRELFALKRSVGRERSLGSDTVLYLDPPQERVAQPEQAAEQSEQREWLRLGLLLLEPHDQEVLDLHWQELTDAEVGERLGIGANTTRMRRNRATARLSKLLIKLKKGELDEVLERVQAAGDGGEAAGDGGAPA